MRLRSLARSVWRLRATTPEKGDQWPNIESANVAMRRYLDLFANVRPVKVPKEGIDWTFFRENTEGAYVLGSKGIMVTDDQKRVDRLIATVAGGQGLSEDEARAQTLAGSPDEVEVQMRDYLDAGVSHFMAMVFAPFERQMDGLQRFAREVIPRFR